MVKNKKKAPVLTADAVIFNNKKEILLSKRGINPFKNYWVLPGGHVDPGERVKETVIREVKEETGLAIKLIDFLGYYDDLKRDPRYYTVTIVYSVKVVSGKLKKNKEALEFQWFSLDKLPKKIGFDHQQIINDFKKWNKKHVLR